MMERRWIFGDTIGQLNKFWQEALNLSDTTVRGLKGNLEEFCSEGELNWPPYVMDLLAEVGLDAQNVVEADQCDTLHWLPELDGQFSSSAYNEIRVKGQMKWWQGYMFGTGIFIHGLLKLHGKLSIG